MALSDSQTGRRPFWRRSGPRTHPIPSLPHSPKPPSLHAVLNTPVDRLRCSLVGELRVPARVSSLSMLPSPLSGRVGVHIVTFEAFASYQVQPTTSLGGSFPPLVICAVEAHPTIPPYRPRPQNSEGWLASLRCVAHQLALRFPHWKRCSRIPLSGFLPVQPATHPSYSIDNRS